ncbi:MAG: Hpt domain-containing protein [Acidobacteriia bacterium]|nr:Hpt domain-containing protein [Terriglobia bacterium]
MELQRALILESFFVESSEGLTQMEQAIRELETRPEDMELLQGIFRVVHTAKGNAGILRLPNLLTFAHSLEKLLDEVRKRNLTMTPERVALLRASLEVLREMTSPAGADTDTLSERAKDVLGKICAQLESDRGRTKETFVEGPASAAINDRK